MSACIIRDGLIEDLLLLYKVMQSGIQNNVIICTPWCHFSWENHSYLFTPDINIIAWYNNSSENVTWEVENFVTCERPRAKGRNHTLGKLWRTHKGGKNQRRVRAAFPPADGFICSIQDFWIANGVPKCLNIKDLMFQYLPENPMHRNCRKRSRILGTLQERPMAPSYLCQLPDLNNI